MSEDKPFGRTMAEIGQRYDERRDGILAGIRERRISASMSGIEYCPRPWAELDMANPYDVGIISTALTWDGERHDHERLRMFSPRELELRAERSKLFYKPHEERKDRVAEIDAELARLRTGADG